MGLEGRLLKGGVEKKVKNYLSKGTLSGRRMRHHDLTRVYISPI